jgi:hypothetical protein
MASGKPIGEFSFKFTSITVKPGPGASTIIEGNYEGTTSVVGTLLGTAAFVGRKSGTYSSYSAAYPDDGEEISGTGAGIYESSGKHCWKTHGFVHLSNGRSVDVEGEIDLATHSWNGKILEK